MSVALLTKRWETNNLMKVFWGLWSGVAVVLYLIAFSVNAWQREVKPSKVKGKTALMLAVGKEDLKRVQMLLKQGVDVNAKDADGNTALHDAVSAAGWHTGGALYADTKHKDLPIAQVTAALLAKGAKVNAQNRDDRTPLMLSLQWTDRLEVVKILVKAGANVRLKDKVGDTALHEAATYRSNPQFIELLVAKGADTKAQDEFGMTPLMGAATFQTVGVLSALLRYGADVKPEDRFARTALFHALIDKSKGAEKIQFLIRRGADINHKDFEGKTVLKRAREKKQNDVVELLTQAGAKE